MNLQSKFGYWITTQTLNVAPCLKAVPNYGQNRDRRSDYYISPVDLSGEGHKNTAFLILMKTHRIIIYFKIYM